MSSMDTRTAHDWKPTHGMPPQNVAEARDNMFAAWAEYQGLVDYFEAGIVTERSVIAAALQIAEDAEAEYHRIWREWDAAKGAALAAIDDECTCTPFITGLCPACEKDAEKRRTEELPY